MSKNEIFFSDDYEDETICPRMDIELECNSVRTLEQLKNATDNPHVKYEVKIKVNENMDGEVHLSVLFPEIFAKSKDNREKYGKIFMYKRKDTDPFLVNAEYTVRGFSREDIDPDNEYTDEIGETTQLKKMLTHIRLYKKVTVLVGTITDFMNPQNPDINDLIYVLDYFDDYNVTLCSRMEQKYDYNLYREMLPMVDAFYRLNAGIKPFMDKRIEGIVAKREQEKTKQEY